MLKFACLVTKTVMHV